MNQQQFIFWLSGLLEVCSEGLNKNQAELIKSKINSLVDISKSYNNNELDGFTINKGVVPDRSIEYLGNLECMIDGQKYKMSWTYPPEVAILPTDITLTPIQ